MRLTHLEVTDHRNIVHAELHPDPHLTVLCGPNGQGKTNLLEAVWLLTGGKSFRGSKDAELIGAAVTFGHRGAFETQDVEKSIRLTVGSRQSQRPGRTGKLNGADVGRAAALAGNFQAVVFEPDLLGLVKGGPDGRRRFMDSALCQVYRPYLVALRRYMRLTAQKNALLKSYDITPNGNMLLDTYDEQLAEYGALIMEHRCKFLAAAAPIAAQNYKDISHRCRGAGAELPDVHRGSHRRGADRKDAGHAQCRAARRVLPGRAAPRGSGNFAGRQPARVFGSQGQQRSCVLAMKLAEATVVGDLFGEHPVLLLDDVLSELDDERQTYLLTRMGEHQTIVTTCDTAAFARTNGKL